MADRLALAAVIVLTGSLAVLVGRDGDAAWQSARVLAVILLAVVGALLARRLSPTARGLVASAAGLVGLAVGVGIGVVHVAKSGPTVISVAGLGCLLSGLTLLVVGARLSLRGRRWWVSVGSVVSLLVASALGLLTVGQALAVVNVPPTELGASTPAEYGLDYQDVVTTTEDGIALSGWYIPSANGGAVVLRHGSGSTRTDTLAHAEVIAKRGYGVLMLDARGHGRSDGRAMDLGWFGDLDVRAGVDFLVSRPEVSADRIAVVGLSMGGEEAIGAAASDPRIAAVVAEGAEQRVPEDKAWLPDVYGVAGTVQGQLDKVMYAVTDLLTSAAPPTPLRDAAASAAPRPILLIAAGADADEAYAARAIRAGAPDSVTVWVLPGAEHTAGLRAAPQQWSQRVIDFLDGALDPGARAA